MNIYLAAPYQEKDNMAAHAEKFEDEGFFISHKWWLVDGPTADSKKCAIDDANGVFISDVLVVLNSYISEGKSFEQGVAYTLRKPIIGIGKMGQHYPGGPSYGNVFHHLPNYYWVDTVEDAVKKLKEWENGVY